MYILSWQIIHLILSIVFAGLLFMTVKSKHLKAHKTFRMALVAALGLLFVNSFGSLLIITVHYLAV
jgi:hypothetical protein